MSLPNRAWKVKAQSKDNTAYYGDITIDGAIGSTGTPPVLRLPETGYNRRRNRSPERQNNDYPCRAEPFAGRPPFRLYPVSGRRRTGGAWRDFQIVLESEGQADGEVCYEGELRITNYELRITNYELRIKN